MPKHAERRALPYSAEQMFNLVADVGRYPEFLPWCVATRIRQSTDQVIVADMVIGFKVFRERFTSKVTLLKPDNIKVIYENGPFKYLNNNWNFISVEDNSCEIDFYVDFEFRSRILEKAIGMVFTEAVHRMVNAFEKRADVLYKS